MTKIGICRVMTRPAGQHLANNGAHCCAGGRLLSGVQSLARPSGSRAFLAEASELEALFAALSTLNHTSPS